MADDALQQIRTFCDSHQVHRLEPDEIRELLADGEDPDWVAGQAADDRPAVAAALTALLQGLAPQLRPATPADPAVDEGIVLGAGPATPAGDATADAEAGALAMDVGALQAELAAMGGQLPEGVDAQQLQQLLNSPRGQLLADFGTFCQERGIEGADEEAMHQAHDEWLQTPRPSLEGKRPAELLEGGRLLPGKVETYRREAPKVGRNDPCPCGSGKKFKKCHGR